MFPFLLFLPLLSTIVLLFAVGFLLSPYFLFSSLSSLHLHNSEASPLLVHSLFNFPSLTYSKKTLILFFPILSLFSRSLGFIWKSGTFSL